ncbi:MAG TPA: hypothetical protein VMM93_07405 [Vicinamibacterales bacterium]|nr:hypothetical protein [Vicinamibacterales bacterium]
MTAAAVLSLGLGMGGTTTMYAGAPDVVGRTLGANGATLVIVGVAPPSFFGPKVGSWFDVAVPLAERTRRCRPTHVRRVLSRRWGSRASNSHPGDRPCCASSTIGRS